MLARIDNVVCTGSIVQINRDLVARGWPLFARRAEGCRFWDLDGKSYVDYLLAFGPIVLGYADPAINQAISRQMRDGVVCTVSHVKMLEVAEQLLEVIPGAEKIAYLIGGSSATTGAVHLARAYTGRELIVRCGYHGWHSWTKPGAPGVPPAISALTLAVPYNDLDALESIFKGHDNRVACVIVESNREGGPRAGYLQGVVDLCRRYGAVSIFDEVKAGFRLAFGGGGAYYGVQPDLATFSKACGNGYPASFIAGRRELFSNEVSLVATFHADLCSLVAIETVIAEMKRRDGIAYQWRMGQRLMDGINQACAEGGLSYRLTGLAPMPKPARDEADDARVMAMLTRCMAKGHYLHPNHHWFLTLAHTEADIDGTITAVREAIDETA